MDQKKKKEFFLNNSDTENIYDVAISYISNRSYTSIVSPQISWSYFSTKKWNLFHSKEIMDMIVLTDMLRQLPRLCPICKVLFLKLLCCMKSVRKSKELEFHCIIFKIRTLQIFPWIFNLQCHHKIWLLFWS